MARRAASAWVTSLVGISGCIQWFSSLSNTARVPVTKMANSSQPKISPPQVCSQAID
jgi:hypothetical protein